MKIFREMQTDNEFETDLKCVFGALALIAVTLVLLNLV